MRVSKFIKLNKNILLEYIYDGDNNIGDPYKILLNNKNNQNNYSYIAGDSSLTNNTVTNQLFQIDSVNNTFGLVNTINYSFLQLKDYSEGFPAKHDTIKIHLPVNYTFDEYIGFYLRVFTFDYNNKKTYELSNYYFDITNIDQNYLINLSNPSLLFQEKLWGKYLRIDIPAVSYLSSLRSGNFAKENTINHSLTNGTGLSITSPVFIDFHFINSKKAISGVTTFNLTPKSSTSLPQTPDFQKLGLKIEHSKNGDFFEIFGTYNGNIAEFNTFINNSVSLGNKYYVVYTITLFEQNIRGKTFKIVTTENFNEKVEYRPIIKFSTTTAIIDVEMNLIDSANDSSIQRRASYGMLQDEVAKYSLNLTKINLARASKPKIYNIKSAEGAGIFGNLNGSAYSDGRLYGNAGGSLFSTGTAKNLFGLSRGKQSTRNSGVGSAFNNNAFGTGGGQAGGGIGQIGVSDQSGINQIADSSITRVVLDPYPVNFLVFADKYNIVAKSENVKVGKKNFYGIGKLKLLIQPFDQLIQFILAKDVSGEQRGVNAGNGTSTEYVKAPEYMDLSNMGEVKLVFKNTKNSVEFKLYTQTQQIDLSRGQIIFRISQNKINEIRQIYDSGINVFYITTTSNTLTTVAYSGLFTMFDDKSNVTKLNDDQAKTESQLGVTDEAQIIGDPNATETGTAIVTRRIIRGEGSGSAAGGGSGTGAAAGSDVNAVNGGDNTTNLVNSTTGGSTGNLSDSSAPSANRVGGSTYEINSSSDLSIDGYTWKPNDIKKALGLSDTPTKLSMKTDALYSNDKYLDKLPDLKLKLEKTLETKEAKDAYKQKQTQTRTSNGTSQQFSYYQNDAQSTSQFGDNTSSTSPRQAVDLGNYTAFDDSGFSTSIPKTTAETLKIGDLISLRGKSWIVLSNNESTKRIKVELDQPKGGPV